MSEHYEDINLEIEEGIATITINRPESMNAMNTETVSEVLEALDEIEDSGARCIILTGAGEKAFIGGADISEMVDKSVAEATEFTELGHKATRKLEKMPIPTIAALDGFTLGAGCEISLACDMIIAAESAEIGQPEINLGIVPGWGGTQRLAKRVGTAKAKELVLTGKRIPAEEAYETGLVNDVVPDDELMEKVNELAEEIASKSKVAIKAGKDLVNAAAETSLETGLELEQITWAKLFDTEDQEEGMEAFLENREPGFKDK